MNIRAFIAVDIDKKNRQALLEIQEELKKINADLKFVEPENIHLTLHFLGNTTLDEVELMKQKLITPISEFPPFTIRPENIGAFPDREHPRVIWIGIGEGEKELTTLQEKIVQVLKNSGREIDERKFHPHLTLARIRSNKNKHFLTETLKKIKLPEFKKILVKEVILFQSTLTPQGPVYNILTKWELGKDN